MDSYPIYTGKPWMDHSTEAFSGWSITLTTSAAALVVAALALLVQMAGEASWGIVAFSLHQWRATDQSETGLFRQTQVILRNPGTSLGTGIYLLKAGWKWRRVVDHALLRSIGLALFPLCIFGGFVTAGIMVSRVTAQPGGISQMLLRPTNCGIQNWNSPIDQDMWTTMGWKWASDTRRSRAYATECYGESSNTLGCSTLPVQQLPYSVRKNVSCPVERRCFGGTVRFDTGLLDSHQHLGINADHKSRVQFQMTTTCAPIDISDTLRDTSDPYIKDTYTNDFFLLGTYMGPWGIYNYTYSYPTYQSIRQISYDVQPRRKMAGPGASSGDMWRPYPEFRLGDKDLTLALVIFNNVAYNHQVYDPVFSANGTWSVSKGNLELNLPDHWFSAVACADQLRICNPNEPGRCTPLTGGYLVRPMGLGLNEKQEATAERVIDARLHSTIFDVLYQQGGLALMASDLLVDLVSPALPRDQWILETTKWFQTTMANVQWRIFEFPNNEWNTDTVHEPNVVKPEDWFNVSSSAMRGLCSQQLVRNTDQYQTFCLSGIAVVVALSIALIIIYSTLESCVFRQRRRRHPEGHRRYKRLSYAADAQLQLLRVTLEKSGYVGWHDKLEDIPFRPLKEDGSQKDIRPDLEEPLSFQMRPMQRGSSGAHVVPNEYRPGYGYGYFGIQQDHGLGIGPSHYQRPAYAYVEDVAPLLQGRSGI